MEPVVFGQMKQHVDIAETEGTPEARLRAYDALKAMVSWLGAGKS
jgi:hypothetical protein